MLSEFLSTGVRRACYTRLGTKQTMKGCPKVAKKEGLQERPQLGAGPPRAA